MKRSELIKLKKSELLDICKKRNITVSEKAKKEEIINFILHSDESKDKIVEKKKSMTASKTPVKGLKSETKTEKSSRKEPASFYDEDRIVLLVRDPYLIYAYWDVSEKTINKFDLGEENSRITLRFFKDDGNFFDVNLDGHMRNCYFQVPETGRRYYAELGVIKNSRFHKIAGSNTVNMPVEFHIELVDRITPELERKEEIFRMSGGFLEKKFTEEGVFITYRGIRGREWSATFSISITTGF